MKELSIEEKAIAYDKALKQIKELTPDENGFVTIYPNEIFPELAESEDERIRKELLEHCKNQAKPYIQTGNKCPQIQSWIAWLEKQGEQKPDVVQHSLSVSDDSNLPTLDESIYHPCTESVHEQESSEWSEDDEYLLDETIKHLEALIRITKKQGSAYSDEIQYYQRDIDWLKILKDRIQPKQEWNKEDIEMLNSAILFVEHSAFTTIGKGKNNVIAWLKNLRDRVKSQPGQE